MRFMLTQSDWPICAHNIIAFQEAEEIISIFTSDNIPIIALKGLALAETIYPHIGMRKMSDIDLLIKKKDLVRVCSKLQNLGFELQTGHSAFLFLKKGNTLLYLDLHVGIPYLKEEEIWDTARTVQINEIEVKTLSLEQSIIYFCYHMAVSHANVEYRWLEDIHRFIEKYNGQIQWQYIVEKLRQYRLTIPAYWCLRKVQETFNTAIADSVFVELEPRPSLKSNLFKLIVKDQKPIPALDYVSTVLFFSPAYLFSVAFPPVDFLKIRYKKDSPLVYAYYLIRPLHLIGDFIKGVGGMVFNLIGG